MLQYWFIFTEKLPQPPSPYGKIPFEHAILSIDGDDDDLFRQICDKPLENIHAGGQSVIINERLSLLFKKHLPIEILKKHHDHDQSSPAEKLKTKINILSPCNDIILYQLLFCSF